MTYGGSARPLVLSAFVVATTSCYAEIATGLHSDPNFDRAAWSGTYSVGLEIDGPARPTEKKGVGTAELGFGAEVVVVQTKSGPSSNDCSSSASTSVCVVGIIEGMVEGPLRRDSNFHWIVKPAVLLPGDPDKESAISTGAQMFAGLSYHLRDGDDHPRVRLAVGPRFTSLRSTDPALGTTLWGIESRAAVVVKPKSFFSFLWYGF